MLDAPTLPKRILSTFSPAPTIFNMRATHVLTAAIALLAPALATPAGHNPEAQLESRATRSSQGWYAYGCYMGELSIHLLASRSPPN